MYVETRAREIRERQIRSSGWRVVSGENEERTKMPVWRYREILYIRHRYRRIVASSHPLMVQ